MATSAVGVRFPEHLVKHEEAWEGCGHVQVVHMLLQHLITDDAVMTEVRAYARIVVVCRYTALVHVLDPVDIRTLLALGPPESLPVQEPSRHMHG